VGDTKRGSSHSRYEKVVTQSTKRGCRHLVDQRGVVVTNSTRDSHQVTQWELSSPSRQEGDCRHQVDSKGGCCHQVDSKGDCRHQVDRKGIVVTKLTSGRYTVDQRGCRHQVDKWSSHSRRKRLSLPGRQKVATQSTNGVAVTKSARRGCRHHVDKRSSHSRPKAWRHKVNPRVGTPSQPKERGHQVNPRSGDTKSTQGAGTPSQPKERGHQVNPRSGDTKSTQCLWTTLDAFGSGGGG